MGITELHIIGLMQRGKNWSDSGDFIARDLKTAFFMPFSWLSPRGLYFLQKSLLLDLSPIIGCACHSLPDWLTVSLLFGKLDWCDTGIWRWQLKTCWSCWWWETVYSVTFSIQFLTVLKSFSRLDSNSLTFLQLVKAVKTLTGGATWSIIYFDFACTTNFPFLFLMAPVGKYMRWVLSLPC